MFRGRKSSRSEKVLFFHRYSTTAIIDFALLLTKLVVVFYFQFPETANIPLEEVAALFGDKVAVRLDDGKNIDPEIEKAVKGQHVEDRTEVVDEKTH